MNKIELALALTRLTFLNPEEKQLLFSEMDDLNSFLKLSIKDISFLISRKFRTKINCDFSLLPRQIAQDLITMTKYQIHFVIRDSILYPPLLREIPNPPFSLFWRGDLPNPEKPLIAMVGTRSPSGDGTIAASTLAKQCAQYGYPIVSGLARGIDAFAHRANLEAGAPTVAVLACGLDRLYPRSNSVLAGRILQNNGCIMSEYAPSEEPLKYRFPMRNRIIAGISRLTVVVEAPDRSGALITANCALDYGKDVFVSKQALHSARSAGTRLLHTQGAKAIKSIHEIFEESNWPHIINKINNKTIHAKTTKQTGLQLALEFKNKISHYR